MKELAKEISDNMQEYESRSFISGSHNFKIDMALFMHACANTFKSDKQLSIIYYMLKNQDSGSMIIINGKMIMNKVEITKPTYYGVINRMIDNDMIKKIDVKHQARGYQKYIINPYMIYNFRKTKSNNKYADNCNLWNLVNI